MDSISVLFLSRVTLLPGVELRPHIHDYWHFAVSMKGEIRGKDGKRGYAPACSCIAPGIPHADCVCVEELHSINAMVLVNDPMLYKRLEQFQFSRLREADMHIPLLISILEQAHTLKPSQNLVNFAFGYYLHLLLESAPGDFDKATRAPSLSTKALDFIQENYRNQIKLEDVARHISRNRTYTAHLLSSATGMTFMEHLNAVRIRHACSLLAYSNLSLDQLARECGFNSTSNFCRVFKASIGTTPNKYRTSHVVDDLHYTGAAEALEVPYTEPVYTYIPHEQKCIDWETPREYFNQELKNS